MKPFDIAMKYRLSEMQVYSVMRYLRTTKGVKFTRQGKRYNLTKEEVQVVEKELERRGYKAG